jgi:hypothetical protein
MLAFAMHLMTTHGITCVRIHPDGEHGKQFDIRGWLEGRGFSLASPRGTTSYGGEYRDEAGRSLHVIPSSGLGDVVAEDADHPIIAECKGGVINTRHPGQKSRLHKGLCEVVGMLMGVPRSGAQYAVVPDTPVTSRLAERLAPRCREAGIEIALISSDGAVRLITGPSREAP